MQVDRILSCSSQTRVLTTADEKEWLEILQHCSLKDPHYLPGYLKIYEKVTNPESFRHFGGQACLFIYGDSQNFIIYPFFKRSIASLPFADSSVSHLFDIVSPYGYGGPLPQIQNPSLTDALWQGFFQAFSSYCLQNNIVSEFARLHPLFENHEPVARFSAGTVEKNNRIVYLDLSKSIEEILDAMTQKRRYNIRKALSNPYLTSTISSGEGLDLFPILYQETMIRKGAELKFLFPGSFFEAAYKALREHLIIVYVNYGHEIISAALSIGYGENCYGWLAGSRNEYYQLYPNDLCIYKTFTTAKARGYKRFVMGGGLKENDSLFKFKAEFSPYSCDFYVYKKIHMADEYLELVKLSNQYARKLPDSFFPEYRSY